MMWTRFPQDATISPICRNRPSSSARSGGRVGPLSPQTEKEQNNRGTEQPIPKRRKNIEGAKNDKRQCDTRPIELWRQSANSIESNRRRPRYLLAMWGIFPPLLARTG